MDGGNAENAGAVFGHALKHAGLAPNLASGARLALRRKDQEHSDKAEGGLRFVNPLACFLKIDARLMG